MLLIYAFGAFYTSIKSHFKAWPKSCLCTQQKISWTYRVQDKTNDAAELLSEQYEWAFRTTFIVGCKNHCQQFVLQNEELHLCWSLVAICNGRRTGGLCPALSMHNPVGADGIDPMAYGDFCKSVLVRASEVTQHNEPPLLLQVYFRNAGLVDGSPNISQWFRESHT